jgi:hypothetical protein
MLVYPTDALPKEKDLSMLNALPLMHADHTGIGVGPAVVANPRPLLEAEDHTHGYTLI